MLKLDYNYKKMKFSIKDLFNNCNQIGKDLVTFPKNKKNDNGKLFCVVYGQYTKVWKIKEINHASK